MTGQATWIDDLQMPELLHIEVLRSRVAHAGLARVDVSRALAQSSDVVAAFSGADLADEWVVGLPCAWSVTPDMLAPPHLPVATEEVRYAGEAVAAVVARGPYAAADALEHVDRHLMRHDKRLLLARKRPSVYSHEVGEER